MDNEKKKRRSGEVIEDIVLEILSRVTSVESLLRFRCVSKSWRSLIDSEFFINRHLQHATRNTASEGHSLVLYSIAEAKPLPSNCCVVGCYLDKPTAPVSWNNIDPLNSDMMDGHIVCHCNGMLLVLKEGERAFLWNPSVRVSVQLPDSGYKKITQCGVGWDQESGAYKVYAAGYCDDFDIFHTASVYSTKTKSWRRVANGFPAHNGTGAYARGRIHWLVRREGRVCMEWWDVRSEVFGTMELPCKLVLGASVRPWLWFWERGGCIHLVSETKDFTARTVWVLEEKTKGSWSWLQHPNPQLHTTVRACRAGAFSIIPTLVKP